MDISIFLARIIGLYLLIIGFLYLGRRQFLEKSVYEFFESNALIVISGVINLILGLLIVVGHNIWEWSWTLVITLLGYLVLLKAFIRLFVSDRGNKNLAVKLSKGSSPIFLGIICLILGLFLIYEGFIVT